MGKTLLGILVVIGALTASIGKAQSFGPIPPMDSSSITNVAGVTYFLHSHRIPICDWIEVGAISRSGTNITMQISEKRGTICPECQDCYHTEHHSTVIGYLEPGSYQLALYLPADPFSPFPGPSLWRVLNFEVPAAAEKMVALSTDTSALKVDVSGVPVAAYIVERSSNLTNWTAIATNRTGSFSLTNSQTGIAQYYRARVSSAKLVIPE